jgi:three-Cys-motif partner protein
VPIAARPRPPAKVKFRWECVAPIRSSGFNALHTPPSGKRLFFIESDERNIASLTTIARTDRRVEIIPGNANVKLFKLCGRLDWRYTRGVVFVDPFGPETDWSMLCAIATTRALDMFWLFPLSAVYRNVPHNRAMLTPEKRATVSRCLGCTEWEEVFYSIPNTEEGDLFKETPKEQRVDVDTIENFVTQRLKNIFPLVEKPARLLGPTKTPLFDLFFAMANPSEAARRVGSLIARHLLKAI